MIYGAREEISGWMCGISGMILAVPILATFKIFCDHIEPMAPIAEFMS
jgi:predicted PurR-regulated permease PerM